MHSPAKMIIAHIGSQ